MTASAVAKSSVRLESGDRRDTLLDSAAEIVSSDGAEAVSMDSVAEHAGVSRPLVYKHFANRAELLAALYARESLALHEEISADVSKARTLEAMFRALVRASLRAQASRGATFAALRAAGGRTDERRSEQRARDRRTLRYFVRQAMDEYSLPETQARAAMSILLGAVDSVLNVFRVNPTPEHATLLEDTYVALVAGGLEGLRIEEGR